MERNPLHFIGWYPPIATTSHKNSIVVDAAAIFASPLTTGYSAWGTIPLRLVPPGTRLLPLEPATGRNTRCRRIILKLVIKEMKGGENKSNIYKPM